MKLYDNIIETTLALLDGKQGKRLDISCSPQEGIAHDERSVPFWPDTGEKNLILRSEMAYELGGGNLPAVSVLAPTSSERFFNGDEMLLYGKDLNELTEDTPYARISIILVTEDSLNNENDAYAAIRKIEFTRFHINPKGFMTRISTSNERESVRVGRDALKEGLNFAKAGSLFLAGYRKHKTVLAVKQIFITLADFPYEELKIHAKQSNKITESLDLILKNLKMDCSSCGLKPVCDEVEGLKELHFAHEKKKDTLNT